MTAAWPSVPYKVRAGSFSGKPFRATDRTPFDDGVQRARRGTTKNLATVNFSITMKPEEFRTFALWVRDTLVDGTLPFTMNVWTGTGDHYESRTCRFASDYGWNDTGKDKTIVALEIDVEDYMVAAA